MNRLFFAGFAIAACGGARQTDVPSASTSTGTSTSASTSFGEMKPPTPTVYGENLQAIGLDPKNLPPLTKLAPEQLRKVMPLIAKSLGVKCNACHDFTAPAQPTVTPRMKVGLHMWNEIVRIRTISPDGSVVCDSCHHGALTFLDRRDRPALEHWMDENFVKGLDAERCATCHGEPPKWKLVEFWKR